MEASFSVNTASHGCVLQKSLFLLPRPKTRIHELAQNLWRRSYFTNYKHNSSNPKQVWYYLSAPMNATLFSWGENSTTLFRRTHLWSMHNLLGSEKQKKCMVESIRTIILPHILPHFDDHYNIKSIFLITNEIKNFRKAILCRYRVYFSNCPIPSTLPEGNLHSRFSRFWLSPSRVFRRK